MLGKSNKKATFVTVCRAVSQSVLDTGDSTVTRQQCQTLWEKKKIKSPDLCRAMTTNPVHFVKTEQEMDDNMACPHDGCKKNFRQHNKWVKQTGVGMQSGQPIAAKQGHNTRRPTSEEQKQSTVFLCPQRLLLWNATTL